MHKFNILYVDDEQSNLRIFKDTFRRRFNVYTAISAKEGMRILEEVKIDLILSDQRMPEMTGVELLKYSFQKFPKTNRILVTGFSDFQAIEDAINHARIYQYVQKPWDESALLDIMSDALRVYELEEENERQKAELKIAKEKAEESDRLKTEFIYNLSHEIRTPMNGIVGFTTLLDTLDLEESQKKEYIKIIQNSSKQLLRVINDILEISQLVTKQIKTEVSSFCLNEFMNELYGVFKNKVNTQKIQFTLDNGLDSDKSNIITDRSKLYVIISNLIENAIKFTHEGHIKIGYQLVGNNITIFVEDTGVGIQDKNKEAIFIRFSQEEKDISNKVGGLGLGLSIATENAKLIKANISLESEKHKGSTFNVSLPYITPEADPNIQDHNVYFSYLKNNKPLKVLIVEDEKINQFYFETVINKLIDPNINIVHANNGEEAITQCKNNSDFDLVFMDIKMPIMDGYEATEKIKVLRPNLPVIALTAYSTDEDRKKAMVAGCNDFISKPINQNIIISLFDKYNNSKSKIESA